MAQLPTDDTGGGQIATAGTILAAIAAGLAAVWRLSRDGNSGRGDPQIHALDTAATRTSQLIESAAVIIDQLQEENARLITRLNEMEQRIRNQELVIQELRTNSGPGTGRRR